MSGSALYVGAREADVAAWARHIGNPSNDHSGIECLVTGLGEGSLPAAFHATAAAHPDRPALAVDGARATHGELEERAGRFAGWLGSKGVGPDSVVVLAAPSSLAMVTAYLGILRAGATVVLINPALTEPELQHLVNDSHAGAALADGGSLTRLRALADSGAIALRVHDLASLFGPDGEPSAPLTAAELLPPPVLAPDSAAVLAYTSGTTGKPKATPLSHRNLLASIRGAMLAWRWEPDDVCLHALPLFHQHGLGVVHASLLSGSRAVVLSRFDPAALCGQIAAERATVLFAVPTIYERLMAWEGIEQGGLASLRLLVCGSAALPPRLAERVAAITGQVPLERYGTTESGLDISNLYGGPRRPGTVGLPLPGVELLIVDGEGARVPDGEDGEIVLRGPQVFAGYRGNDEANANAFLPDGWFRTGDIGRVDRADGYLSITGRAKELIVSGGMNVYPREVEFALLAAPAVEGAAVVGVPDDHWGEQVAAAVVLREGARQSADELLEFVRTRLASYKCPKRIVFVDELPVNAMGKVVSARVAELVAQA